MNMTEMQAKLLDIVNNILSGNGNDDYADLVNKATGAIDFAAKLGIDTSEADDRLDKFIEDEQADD